MFEISNILDKKNRPKLALALLRVGTGVMFLMACWPKVSAGGGWGQRMVGFINFQENTPEWYRGFLDSVVIPNADLFGFFTAYGELALAIALILGVFTRPALIVGVFMVINYMLTKGGAFWVPTNHDSFYFMVMLALLFQQPGKFLGLDSWLSEKFPKLPI